MFKCDTGRWNRIEAKHRLLLAQRIRPTDSVLDAACGYGRLVSMLPPHTTYLGVDISPDMLKLARDRYPMNVFVECDLRSFHTNTVFDWCVLISVKHMVIRNAGQDVWDAAQDNLLKCSRKLLFLEYDEFADAEEVWRG